MAPETGTPFCHLKKAAKIKGTPKQFFDRFSKKRA
jgi:hypothetical protein